MSSTESTDKMFDWENAISMDTCALAAKQHTNTSIFDYLMYSDRNDVGCEVTDQRIREFSDKYPNLRFRNGYGVTSACTVDADTEARMVGPTHGHEKRQLDVRNFHAVPFFGRGCLAPDTESFLKNGQSSTFERSCEPLTERNFDRFVPFLDCIQKHVDGYAATDYFPVGMDSRETYRKHMRKMANTKANC
jgi:hypothetical protein